MRSSLFGCIDYYLNYLITILPDFRLNYHLTEKSEFVEKASLGEPFSAYSVLDEAERNGVERKRSTPLSFKKISFVIFGLL